MKIFDGHNDILNRLTGSDHPRDTSGFLAHSTGQLDLPKARQGELIGGLFAVYPSNPPSIPAAEDRLILTDQGYEVTMAPPLELDYSRQEAQRMIDLLYQIEADSGGELKVIQDYSELWECLEQDTMAAVLHLEGAEPILPDLSNFADYYQLGMRSLGLVWSRPNQFGFGVPFKFPSSPDTGPGLTEAGKELVITCNQNGVMIDLAHLNEKGFWDVAEISTAPLVSSHSAAWSLIPKARNLKDDQLQAIARSDGLVGVIFSVNDLDAEARPKEDGPISAIIKHITYLVDLMGVDHVAFGSDFDGTKIPSELGNASKLQVLVDLLEQAGFSNLEQQKICSQNWLRVLESTWK